MARGTAFSDLIVQLRAEAGHSVLVAAGIDNEAALKQILNRVQEVLFDDFNWPFKTITPFLNLTNGDRYYDLPASIDFEHIVKVAVYFAGQPSQIEKGISYPEYAVYDSELNEKSSPVQRWDIKYVTNATKLEVWPIPDDDTQKLQFTGQQKLVKMVADGDLATLDDSLLVLTCAAEILARQKDEDAPLKQKMARARYTQLRALYSQPNAPFVMGGGSNPPPQRGQTVIRVR
jgi:hypothetical protein